MARRLFSEICPLTYAIAVEKMRMLRRINDLLSRNRFSYDKESYLPIVVYKHKSMIRRILGDVDMQLQENKAVNLALAAKKVNGIVIKPGSLFSFWKLVGSCTKRKGYKEGLIISKGRASSGIGGGMCQFTNLIHWLVLHSPLEIKEHHHHDGLDMFPDYGRKVPFGCGTSIMYNYLDYRFMNNTTQDFQLVIYTTDTHLCGELRTTAPLETSYHVLEEDACFVKKEDAFYRQNTIYKQVVDMHTGNEISREMIKKSNAKVLYDEKFIPVEKIRSS